jgi:hypothetical protein
VLLLTDDDVLEQRGQRRAAPRDNLIFEAGLCMGLLGPARTLLVQELDLDLRLPSDLEGITRVRFPASPGWEVANRTPSSLCLRYSGGRAVEVRLGLGSPERARQELRQVALVLHKLGVRVGQDLLPSDARIR